MNEVVKRRAAGALVLIGLAFIAVSLLPGVGETPGEDGVKVVVIDLDAPEPVKPDALPLETPPPGVARADEPLPAEVAEAQGTDSLPDPGEAPAGTEPEAEPEPEPASAPSPDESTTRPSLKLAETISTTKPKPAEAPPKPAATTTTEKPAAKPATPPTATAAAPKPVKPAEAPVPAPVPATKPTTTPPPAAATKPGSAWFVQVGGFADIQNARQAQDRLKAVGQASIIAPMESAHGTLYRVRAGPYKTREAAAAAQQKIASGGFTGSALVNP